MTGCPRDFVNPCATVRAALSEAPPAANGTIRRIGFAGYCAKAPVAKSAELRNASSLIMAPPCGPDSKRARGRSGISRHDSSVLTFGSNPWGAAMDKLRALHYFVTAAERGSFTAAARRFEVSVPAVAKLVTALEKSLGARLVNRAARGLTLTADGESYLEACRPLLQELTLADERVNGSAARPRGLLTVGAPSFVAQHCVLPALVDFHARYPDIHVDVRLC